MEITNYASLKEAAIRWSGGSSDSNFSSVVEDAISFAEDEMSQRLWTPERIKRVKATFTAEYEAIPDDCSKLISIKPLVDDREGEGLSRQHTDAMPGLACAWRDRPRFYALVGAQVQIVAAPTVEDPLEVRWIYYGMIPRLSDDESCTAVLQTYPTIYLYATLKHLAPFADDIGGMQKWSAMSDQAIETANRAAGVR